MDEIFQPPRLDSHDHQVIEEVDAIRAGLTQFLRSPRRWQGGLRRSAQAKAIQGSNSIEGYSVSEADAAAAVDEETALGADERTWAEVLGYRRLLTYVLTVATSPSFVLDEGVLQAMHFMLLEHDLDKTPGRYRTGPVYVAEGGQTVYTAPEAATVPELTRSLIHQARAQVLPPLVAAAMAHLNLVMVHPFRDGNGRMGRALQTLVLARDQVLEPAFSSIEEWLGANTADYYAVLTATGAGAWHPERDTRLWVQFNLRAHHMQAQTVRRRFDEAVQQWSSIDALSREHKLPERMGDALFDGLLGFRLTRPSYAARSGLDDRQATRDLARLTDLGMLTAHGQTRGRYYTAGPVLSQMKDQTRADRKPLADPYPDLVAQIRREAVAILQPTAAGA